MFSVKIKCRNCGKYIEYAWQQKGLEIKLIPHECECQTLTNNDHDSMAINIKSETGETIIIPDHDFAAIKLILAELDRARTIHTAWPASIVRQAAFLAEEAGECIRAANRVEDDKIGTIDQVITEAVQTGAMAIRLIVANTIE